MSEYDRIVGVNPAGVFPPHIEARFDNLYYTKDEVEAAIQAAIAALPKPPDPVVEPDPGGTPSAFKPWAILNLGSGTDKNHYYLQAAIDGESTYRSVTLPELVAGYSADPYFKVVTDASGVNRVQMRVSVGGPRTSGSNYARTELRELDQSGNNIAFNPTAAGTHRQAGKSTITALPPNKPETVIAQLHNSNKDRIAIRTQAGPGGVGNKISIRVNGTVNAPGWQDTANYVLGTEVSWKMECINGTWRVYINDMTTPKVTVAHSVLQDSDASTGVTASSWYFKAGNYIQSSTTDDAATAYATVLLRDLTHTHPGWGEVVTPPVLGTYPTQVTAAGNAAALSINLTWAPPASTGGKTISGYIASRNNPTYETANLGADARSFLFTNFSANTPYTVGVRTVFTDGTSSSVVNAPAVTLSGGSTTQPDGGITGTVKIMPTGDSLTAVDASALGYKGILLDSLVAAGRTIDYVGPYTSTGPAGLKDPHHYGLSGAQTSTLLGQYLDTTSNIGQRVTQNTPDIITLLIGVNDLWSDVPTATALTRYRQVLDMAYAAKPNVKIIACRIPLMGVPENSERATFNAGVSQIVTDYQSAGKSITLADLSNTLVSSDLQSDGIHWTSSGHTKVAAALLPVVQSVIAGTGSPVVTDPNPPVVTSAAMPYPTNRVVLYHMMWTTSGSPMLSTTPANVNILRLAFMQGTTLTGPASEGSMANLSTALKALRARGVRITLSVGGGGYTQQTADRAAFVNGVMNISNTICPLDGLDWDMEGGEAAPNQADAIAICQSLRSQRGTNFAITMAPNGTNINNYLTVAKALNAAKDQFGRSLLDGFGQQFYDAPVDQAAMMGRIDTFAASLPIAKYEIGNMVGTTANFWTVDTCLSRWNAARAKYPSIGGAYLWEAGRAGTADWANRVGGAILASG